MRSVARLTALHTLSIAGCGSVAGTVEALYPLSSLTALAVEGTDTDRDDVLELGEYLLAFPALQRLDVDMQYDTVLRRRPKEPEPMSEGEAEAVREEFWEGVWGALRVLPLSLGATIGFKVITAEDAGEAAGVGRLRRWG